MNAEEAVEAAIPKAGLGADKVLDHNDMVSVVLNAIV